MCQEIFALKSPILAGEGIVPTDITSPFAAGLIFNCVVHVVVCVLVIVHVIPPWQYGLLGNGCSRS
jgi:hypothetical protein